MEKVLLLLGSTEFWQFMGFLAVVVGAIWMNPFVRSKLKDIKLDVNDNLKKIEKKLIIIDEAIKENKIALKENTELTAMTKTRKETIESLTTVVSGALEYIGDVKLREFIEIKTKSIIQFNLDLLELDLGIITDLQVKTKLTIEKNAIAKIGYEILGQEFIDGFYKSIHGESTNWYERDILNILHCKINYKADAIRARTEVFIRETIRALSNEYDVFLKNK